MLSSRPNKSTRRWLGKKPFDVWLWRTSKMQKDIKNANLYLSFFVCFVNGRTKWKLFVSKMHFMCFDVGWITTCWWLTETLPADSSAYFSPLVEGCARKARILPNAEGKGHLKLEDAFVENHPFFKSRRKCYKAIEFLSRSMKLVQSILIINMEMACSAIFGLMWSWTRLSAI